MTTPVAAPETKLQKFIVRFENPETHLLHSSVPVEVTNGIHAVKAAIDIVQTTMRGTEIDRIPTYIASVVDEFGNGVAGLEKSLSKAQIAAQIKKLSDALALLDDDGQTPSQVAAAQSIPGVQQVVAAPPPANPAEVPPTVFTPPTNVTPEHMAVDPSAAPKVNSGSFTQADVQAMINAALSNQQQGPAMPVRA
jgi:hypothetical protein